MKAYALLVALAAALMLAPVASAHSYTARTLSDAHVGRSKSELLAQRDYSRKVVRRLAGSWRVAPRHATCWSHVPWSHVCNRARQRLLAHRWLYRTAQHRLDVLYPVIGHWALWNCIHNGAYPGAPHEGNGWSPNGLYSGPLQMSSGWEGYPISDWNAVPLATVYADADAVYEAHGRSTAWLAGQWPHTSPPCFKFG